MSMQLVLRPYCVRGYRCEATLHNRFDLGLPHHTGNSRGGCWYSSPGSLCVDGVSKIPFIMPPLVSPLVGHRLFGNELPGALRPPLNHGRRYQLQVQWCAIIQDNLEGSPEAPAQPARRHNSSTHRPRIWPHVRVEPGMALRHRRFKSARPMAL